MTGADAQELVDAFTRQIEERLDAQMLEGPVRLDNTRTVVIIPVKGKGRIYAHIRGGVTDAGAQSVLTQLKQVPSLMSLVRAD